MTDPSSAASASTADALASHARFVRALALRLVRDENDADDLRQETFLRALRSPPRLKAGLASWLAKVARTVAIGTHRGESRRAARERATARPEATRSAGDELERAATFRALADAVLELPPDQRRAVFLRYYDALPPRRIAKELGIPVATVHSRLRRAIETLRARLDARHGHDRARWLVPLAAFAGARIESGLVAAALSGVALMSTKLKIASALVLALACAGAWWAFSSQALPDRASRRSAFPPLDAATGTADPGHAEYTPAPLDSSTYRELAPAAVVSRTLRGRVVSAATGSGIPGAQVRISIEGPGRRETRSAETDAGGSFELGIPADSAGRVLAAKAKGYAMDRAVDPVTDNRSDDLGTIALQPGASLRGRIIDAVTRDPIAGAHLRFEARHRPSDFLEVETTSGEDGCFAAEDLGPAFIDSLRIEHADWAPSRISLESQLLQPASVGDLGDLALTRGCRLTGRVVAADGAPVPHAEIGIEERRNDGHIFYNLRTLGRADAAGAFCFEHLAPSAAKGQWILAFGAGSSGWTRTDRMQGEACDVTIIARPGVGARVEVVGPDGKPVARAEVHAAPLFDPPNVTGSPIRGPITPAPPAIRDACIAMSDESGVAVFTQLPTDGEAGSYQLFVQGRGLLVETAVLEHGGPGHEPVHRVVLHPRRLCIVSGRVLTTSGSPVAGAGLHWKGSGSWVSSDVQGAFRMPSEEALRAETRELLVVAGGFAPASQKVMLRQDADVDDVEVRLEEGAAVAGTVCDEDGQGIPCVLLAIEPSIGSEAAPRRPSGEIERITTSSASDGSFRFPGVRRGSWKISILAARARDSWQRPYPTVRVDAGEGHARLVLRRAPKDGIELEARAFDAATKEDIGVRHATLATREGDTVTSSNARTTIDGSVVRSSALHPGDWSLYVQTADGREAVQAFVVEPGERLVRMEVPVRAMKGSGRLLGRVSFGDAARPQLCYALTREYAQAADAAWNPLETPVSRMCPVAPDGTFRFIELKPGPLHLRVRTSGALLGDAAVTVTDGGDHVVEVELKPAGTLVLRGIHPAGVKRVFAIFERADGQGTDSANSTTKPDERFELGATFTSGLIRWRLCFQKPDGTIEDRRGEAPVEAGGATRVDL